MLASAVMGMRRLAAGSRGDPASAWIADTVRGATAALASFAVSATFLDAAYFDLVYNILSIAVVLNSAVALEAVTRAAEDTPPPRRRRRCCPRPRLRVDRFGAFLRWSIRSEPPIRSANRPRA